MNSYYSTTSFFNCHFLAEDTGGELFEIVLKGPVQAEAYINDLNNGSYQAFYKCARRGIYKLKVSLNGVNLGGMFQGGKLHTSPTGSFFEY
jgi:hypothetical protein